MSSRTVLGVVALLVGGVWIAQGVDVLKGSFMTGQPFWAVVGAVLVVVGVVLIAWDVRARRDRQE